MITSSEYVPFLVQEYLRDFIAQGGAAVKFLVPQPGRRVAEVIEPLRAAAESESYVVAQVDARVTKVHMIDKVFHDVARQIKWEELALVVARRALVKAGFRLPEGDEPLDLEGIAKENDYAVNYLNIAFNRQLQVEILHDYELTQEFRHAMIALCRAQVDRGSETQTTAASVLEWLRGDLRHISRLRGALIYQRISRYNARDLLFSSAIWSLRADRRGLLLFVDIAHLTIPKRDEAGGYLHYTRPVVMDAYEVFRQFIDEVDGLRNCMLLVGCSPEFLTDPTRGMECYHALKIRIADEVRDRNRSNPYGALVRIGATRDEAAA